MKFNYVDNIIPIIKRAGRSFSSSLRFKRSVELKGISNYVTDLDKKIERNIIKEINKIYPKSQFISEERDVDISDDTFWVLDPLDGTTNMLHGFDSAAISLAHVAAGSVDFGVVYNLSTHEIFYAESDRGAFLIKGNRTKRLNVSKVSLVSNSLIGFGFPYDKSRIHYLFLILQNLIKDCDDIKRVGPASVDICNVAAGRLDAYLELDLEYWDYCAGSLILSEAGGKISDFNNRKVANKSNILATNGILHDEMLERIGCGKIS